MEYSPERRLFAAIALSLVDDFDSVLKKVQYQFHKTGFTSLSNLMDMRRLYREADSEWFSLVCEFSGVNEFHIKESMKRKYKLYGIPMDIKGMPDDLYHRLPDKRSR